MDLNNVWNVTRSLILAQLLYLVFLPWENSPPDPDLLSSSPWTLDLRRKCLGGKFEFRQRDANNARLLKGYRKNL